MKKRKERESQPINAADEDFVARCISLDDDESYQRFIHCKQPNKGEPLDEILRTGLEQLKRNHDKLNNSLRDPHATE